jgi:hypothetical protein
VQDSIEKNASSGCLGVQDSFEKMRLRGVWHPNHIKKTSHRGLCHREMFSFELARKRARSHHVSSSRASAPAHIRFRARAQDFILPPIFKWQKISNGERLQIHGKFVQKIRATAKQIRGGMVSIRGKLVLAEKSRISLWLGLCSLSTCQNRTHSQQDEIDRYPAGNPQKGRKKRLGLDIILCKLKKPRAPLNQKPKNRKGRQIVFQFTKVIVRMGRFFFLVS